MMPPRTILAPVDFSDPSRTALAAAGRLAHQSGATLVVLFAEHPLLAEAARHAHIDLATETDAELERFVTGTSPAPAPPPRRHVRTGEAVDVIVSAAQELGADLIVIGSHGMSGAERLVFGSTTEGVLRKSPVSVLVTPATWNAGPAASAGFGGVGPVVVGVDFTPESIAAAKAACALAETVGTTVTLLHVVSEFAVPPQWQPHAEAVVRNRREEAGTQLASLAQTLRSREGVATRIVTGDVSQTLAAAAAPTSAARPLLVLGRKAPGRRDGAPGAIAYRVLMLAQVPVLVHVAGHTP